MSVHLIVNFVLFLNFGINELLRLAKRRECAREYDRRKFYIFYEFYIFYIFYEVKKQFNTWPIIYLAIIKLPRRNDTTRDCVSLQKTRTSR